VKARKVTSGHRNVAFVLVSLVIVMVFGLETFAALTQRQRTFPFQSYPMYSSYHPAGDVLADAPQAVAILENGEEVLLSPADIFPEIRDKDLRFFVFNRNFVGPVLSADRATIGRRLESYVKSTGPPSSGNTYSDSTVCCDA
jgi:hypothetical protein